MEESDASLVARIRRGEADAFDVLMRRYMPAAFAVALAQGGEPADAEDVCQDAFLTALRSIEDCKQPERFGAWLLQIVRNRAHNARRHRAVRAAAPLEDAMHVHGGSDPMRDAEKTELRAELLAALGQLTHHQREVVLLFDFEGWTHQEIAEKLGITEGSARVHLHKARRALRDRFRSGRHMEA